MVRSHDPAKEFPNSDCYPTLQDGSERVEISSPIAGVEVTDGHTFRLRGVYKFDVIYENAGMKGAAYFEEDNVAGLRGASWNFITRSGLNFGGWR